MLKSQISYKIFFVIICSVVFGSDITLKEYFFDNFLVGVTVNNDHFYGKDAVRTALIKDHFNSITSENVLKWESVHPKITEYEFDDSDRFVCFGRENHMKIIGHALIWHQQTPHWVFEDAQGNQIDRDQLVNRMRSHIHTVVSRYKGKIHGWDVVNEALSEDGTLRRTPWLKIIGEDYLMKAFQFAHEADPDAELYYNDYGLENEPKRKSAIALITELQQNHIPIAAVGLQGHYTLDWPSLEQIENTIAAFSKLGIKINVSELDIDILPQAWDLQNLTISPDMHASLNPYMTGLPDSLNKALAHRYAELFSVFLKHSSSVKRVTFWGLTDQDSWLNNIPIKDRTNYPLLFDREGKSKPALKAILSVKSHCP